VRLEPIESWAAREFISTHHYSGRAYSKSRLHFGCFLGGKLIGVLQWGPSIDTRRTLCLVPGTRWDGYLELNRMAFLDDTPHCVESRCLSVAARLIQKGAPHIGWLLSYADGCQCGTGASYRGAGWLLTGIRENTTLWRTPDGRIVSDIGIRSTPSLATRLGCGRGTRREMEAAGLRVLPGRQYRYMRMLTSEARSRLAVPVLPYSDIDAGPPVGSQAPPAPVGARRDRPAPPTQRTLWDRMPDYMIRLPDRAGPGEVM